ncbi:DUF1543 domain-containing protein [Fastidiosibacter lacustris]|uniref:DUF1543 domain-containing protein n=1 Tax=Fastidiosibacter lacustris TaxID=2056695 RepID=UPI000E353C8E|nr:DUF1543 domain-containing protein [Fastidiosibacter lacustris]
MKLYLAHLGFYDDRYGMYEIHINKHVVAENIKDAKQKLFQDEEFKRLKMHIDGLQEVNIVSGYKISATKVEHYNENNPTYSHCDVKKLVI